MLVQQRDGVAHAVVRLHRDERRDLAGGALAGEDVADDEVGLALEEAVLAHPAVGVDLRQVRAAAVGEDHDDHRFGIVDLAGDLERGVQRQAPGAPGEDPLELREPARGQERVLVGDGHPPVDHVRIERLRPEVLPHPLHEVRADVLGAAGVDRPLGVGPDHDEVGVALAEVTGGAGHRSAGADADDQMRDPSAGLIPHLGPGRLVVSLWIRLVEVLVGLEGAGDLLGQPIRDPVVGLRRIRRDVGRGDDDLGAVGAQQIDLLLGHLVRHHRNHPVALEPGDDRQPGPGVA